MVDGADFAVGSNGEFQMATADSKNLFVSNGELYIMPTLTSDEIGASSVLDGYTYPLSGCTTTNAVRISISITQSILHSPPTSSKSFPQPPPLTHLPIHLPASILVLSPHTNAPSTDRMLRDVLRVGQDGREPGAVRAHQHAGPLQHRVRQGRGASCCSPRSPRLGLTALLPRCARSCRLATGCGLRYGCCP